MWKIKKIIFLIVIVLILVVGGGFFWWQKREIKGSPKDYVIREMPEGKIVENKRAKFTIKVPREWGVKKIEEMEGSVILYASELQSEITEKGIKVPLEKGCVIGVAVTYKKMGPEEIKKEVKAIHMGIGIKSEKFEEIVINKCSVLKNTFDSQILGPAIVDYFLVENKIPEFSVYWASADKERCIQEFNKFLETVSIK